MKPENLAPAAAIEAAAQYGATPTRAIDNEFGDPCWMAFEWPESALVVYDDEPDCIVATGNHEGRFSPR